MESRIDKEIEVQCQGVTLSGKVARVEGNILHLQKDDETAYVNIDKIVVVWDSREKKSQSPGFLAKSK
ncbi:MAG: hypothetical protein JST85_05550 [Acidobacteria bacterium]|nr:hypothetical protein [Acidobacteriota bacterium]